MKTAILLTHNGLELPCVILPVEKNLFPIGKEVLVYCQNRLVRGYIENDETFVAELEIMVDYAEIPELDNYLQEEKKVVITEIYYL